jgi:hypothetical protein
MNFRTRFQRGNAAGTLMRDLELRTTNPGIKEICRICYTLIAAPVNARAAIDARAAELVAAAEARRKRLLVDSGPNSAEKARNLRSSAGSEEQDEDEEAKEHE